MNKRHITINPNHSSISESIKQGCDFRIYEINCKFAKVHHPIKRGMRKFNLLYIALLFVPTACHNERQELPEERLRTDSLVERCKDSVFAAPDRMKAVFSRAQKGLTDSQSIYRLRLMEGLCDYNAGRTESGEKTEEAVLAFCKRTPGNEALEAACYNQRAVIMQFGNRPDSAISCLRKACGLLEACGDKKDLSDVYINLADMYYQTGKYPSSVSNYRRALFVADSLHIPQNCLAIYTGLAQNYTALWNFRAANHYFNQAERLLRDGSERERYFFYNSRGNSLYTQERYKEALPCFLKARELATGFKNPYDVVIADINLGEIYTLVDKHDSARHCLNRVETFLKKAPEANRQQLFYLNSLRANLALRENDLATAGALLLKPYDKDLIYKPYQLLHFRRLMDWYARRGDYKQAWHYRDLVEAYDDSLRNLRNANNINEIDYRYSQDTTLLQRNVAIARADVQLLRQRTIIFCTAALLTACILAAILLFMHLKRKNERRFERQRMTVAELRLENIRNRISPHYLFNVLNSLMPAFRQHPDLKRPLRLLVDVLRGNLLASDRVAVELGEELDLVKNYVALRKETNAGTPAVNWDIAPSVPPYTMIPSMIIQIPIENTLKYAFAKSKPEDEKRVDVHISLQSGGTAIRITDNGSGYHPGEHREFKGGTGTGLKVLFRTIDLLNLKNKEKARFEIRNIPPESGKTGTETEIFIPFHYQFKF